MSYHITANWRGRPLVSRMAVVEDRCYPHR
ncbi:hypothetical protein JYT20_01150 [Rhodothermus sp. AH-315-K08]|nr:hypothetical protein [Rhodothermus sp. AH-315-K08]